MDVQLPQPTVLYHNNEATIRILHHKSNETRTKHIVLRVNYLSTDLMTADTLTRALSGTAFVLLLFHLFLIFNAVTFDIS